MDTDDPGCMASSTSRSFSAADHRRRRCTDVITSTRGPGVSEFVVIVVFIGVRLCLIELCQTVRLIQGAIQWEHNLEHVAAAWPAAQKRWPARAQAIYGR